MPGTAGAPVLLGTGDLTQGSPGTVSLSSAAPYLLSIPFVSLASTPLPFKCGTLVPLPQLLQLSLFTNGAGSILLGWPSWPGGLSGLSLYLQYAIADPPATCGVALSNALRADLS